LVHQLVHLKQFGVHPGVHILKGGTPIDFVSAKYLLKKGEKLETIQYKPNTYRFFK